MSSSGGQCATLSGRSVFPGSRVRIQSATVMTSYRLFLALRSIRPLVLISGNGYVIWECLYDCFIQRFTDNCLVLEAYKASGLKWSFLSNASNSLNLVFSQEFWLKSFRVFSKVARMANSFDFWLVLLTSNPKDAHFPHQHTGTWSPEE